MYEIISKYYDMMYVNDESYRAEVDKVVSLVEQYKESKGNMLLDIACGTGAQAAYLQNYFTVTGIDISDEMLEVAKNKTKDAIFINADMCDFNLNNQYDVIVNLYGSIGHAESLEHMQMAMECVFKHLKQGGIFILTPWSTKESFNESLVGRTKTFELSGFCRMETVRRVSVDKIKVDFHHLISDNLEVTYYKHESFVTLFSESEYESSIQKAGLKIIKRLQPDEFRMGAFVCTV
ncbi:MAG: class I SAM-dependent methyltransferase [Oscillospiraceae bacterium]|nr:class I SAM-dependent methyltransferase [Oscillospiraceae bacterium]